MRIETIYEVEDCDGRCILETPSWRAALSAVEALAGPDLDAETDLGASLAVAVAPSLWVEHPGPLDGDAVRLLHAETQELAAAICILWAVEGEDLEPSAVHTDRDGVQIWGLCPEIDGPGEDCCEGEGCADCGCGL